MPIVDENRLKGNLAGFTIAAWLSRQCLVRPVAEGTDVGIDLFCETVERSSCEPFLHFWVQVKGGNQVSVRDGRAQCSVKAHHLRYWERQPVPVYIFLVPPAQLHALDTVYVISLARVSIKEPLDQDTVTLASNLVYTIEGTPSLDDFVDTSVRIDHVLLEARRGVDIPLPQPKPGYYQTSVKGFRTPFVPRYVDQIRRSASSALRDMVKASGNPTIEARRQMAVLAAALEPFISGISESGYWEQHYEDYWAMGLYKKRFGDRGAGESYLRRAIQIIREDGEFCALDSRWKDAVSAIEDDLSKSADA